MSKKSTYDDLKQRSRELEVELTECRNKVSRLSDSETSLMYVLEHSVDAAYRRNLRTDKYDFMSPSIEKILGYTNEEMIGMSTDEVIAKIHPEDNDRIAHVIKKSMVDNAESCQIDYRIKSKDGDYRWLADLFSVINDDQGNPGYRVGSVRDITEQKKIEEDLLLFKAIIETSQEAIAISDPKGQLIYVNPAHEKLFGRSLEEARRSNYRDYYPPESVEILNREVVPALERNEGWEGEIHAYNASGKSFSLWERADSIHDANGQIIYNFGVMHDVTKRKLAEATLRDSEARFKSLFDNSMDGIMFTSQDGSIFMANRAACEMLGKSEEEICDGGRDSVVDLKDPRLLPALSERSRTGKFKGDLLFKKKNGDSFPVEISSTIFALGDREQRSCITFRDITQRKRMEQDLAKQRDYLEKKVDERTEELQRKAQQLEEMNSALNILLIKRDEDKKNMEESVVKNIKDLIIPYLEKTKLGKLDSTQQVCIDIIEKHLAEIVSPMLKNLHQFNLTHREVQVAILVNEGKSSKRIAEILGVAKGSVDTHRKSIRKKLSLSREANLQSRLDSLK